ncbi:MAG: SEC-C metal-binding domain-containing protein [Anaerolineae bacterium]
MASVGRNDPCPCGSGKKYKRCHWRIDQEIQRQHLQLERAWETLGQRTWEFGVQGRLVAEFASAWDLYWDNRVPLPAMSALGLLERSRFLDWYVFDYRTSTRKRVAEVFVEVQQAELTPLEQDLIRDWVKTHVSVYDVTDAADDRLDLQDVFTDEVRSAEPIGEDQSVLKGSLLMGRLLPVGGSLRFAPGVMPLLPDAGEPLREFVQPRFEAWQQARYGADWNDFLNEAGYLLNHFLIQDMEPIEVPAIAQHEMDPVDAARAIARRMQGRIITTALDLHYERWLDEPAPEWNGKTPREMVETPDGAEMVQTLLDMLEEIERERAESGQPAYDVDLLRRKLGLTGEVRTEGGIVLPG